MSVNRYTQFKSMTYNPLTLEELMLVPKMQAEAAGAAEDYLGKIESLGNYQIGYINDSAGQDAVNEYQRKLSSDISTIREKLLNNPNSVGSVLTDANRINRDMLQQLSPSGLLGVNKSQYGAALENMKELQAMYQSGQLSAERYQAGIQAALGDYRNQNDPMAKYSKYTPPPEYAVNQEVLKYGALIKPQKFVNFLDQNFDKMIQDPHVVSLLKNMGVDISNLGKWKGSKSYGTSTKETFGVEFTDKDKVKIMSAFYLGTDQKAQAYLNDVQRLNLGDKQSIIENASNLAAETYGGVHEAAYNQEYQFHPYPQTKGRGNGKQPKQGDIYTETRLHPGASENIDVRGDIEKGIEYVNQNKGGNAGVMLEPAKKTIKDINTIAGKEKTVDAMYKKRYDLAFNNQDNLQKILFLAKNSNSSSSIYGFNVKDMISYDGNTFSLKIPTFYKDAKLQSQVESEIKSSIYGLASDAASSLSVSKDVKRYNEHYNNILNYQKQFGITDFEEAKESYISDKELETNFVSRDMTSKGDAQFKENRVSTILALSQDAPVVLVKKGGAEKIMTTRGGTGLKDAKSASDFNYIDFDINGNWVASLKTGETILIPIYDHKRGEFSSTAVTEAPEESGYKAFLIDASRTLRNMYKPTYSNMTIREGKNEYRILTPMSKDEYAKNGVSDYTTGVHLVPAHRYDHASKKVVNGSMYVIYDGKELIPVSSYIQRHPSEASGLVTYINNGSSFLNDKLTTSVLNSSMIYYGANQNNIQTPIFYEGTGVENQSSTEDGEY